MLPFFVALMRSLLVLILSSAAICFPLFGSESFEGKLQDIFDSSGLPGLAVGVIEEGKNDSHYLFGHSDLSRSEKTTSETRFRAGSISKLLTSLLALRLQEKGELKLTDLINEELPDHLIGPGASEVTLAHLLEHTSGLAGSSYREYATNETDLSPTDYLKQEAPFKLRWEPGLHYSYSNPGYTIAAGYIEERLGIDFDTLMQREMFTPLGMKASSFSTSTTPVAESPAPRWEMPIRPAGSLVTSIPDLLGLLQVLIKNDSSFLSSDSIERLHKGQASLAAKAGADTYGLGCFGFVVDGHLFRGHWGRTEGFQATLGYLPEEKKGFVILTNGPDRRAMNQLRKVIGKQLTTDSLRVSPPPSDKGTEPVPGIYLNYSHDMPMRAWLFALLEAKSLSLTRNGIIMKPASFGNHTTKWIPRGEFLYQAENLPVPTAVFFEHNGTNFWSDGESFRHVSTWSFWAELSVLLLGLACSLLVTITLPLIILVIRLKTKKKPEAPTSSLFLAALSYVAIFGIFIYFDLFGRPSTATQLGIPGISSLALTFCSLFAPVMICLCLLLSIKGRNYFTTTTALPIFFLGLLLAYRGWLPLITF